MQISSRARQLRKAHKFARGPRATSSGFLQLKFVKRCPSIEFFYGYVAAGSGLLELDWAPASRLLCHQIFVGPILGLVANVDLIVRRVGIDVERLSLLPNGRYLSLWQRLEFLPLFSGGRDLRFETG